MKVGIDIVKNSRFETGSGIENKMLSNFELDIYNEINSNNKKQEFLASRWCLKEAIIKTNSNLLMKNISIIKRDNKPFYNNNYELSLSHEKEYSVAIAIKI